MIIMALDHVRDYFYYGSFFTDPTNLSTTTPMLFFTRWITHFCAPVFIFLAGTSAFLYGTRRSSKKEISKFLLTRGIWLIVLELTIVNFAWTFDITLSMHFVQVIWAIGICMVLLSALIYLSLNLQLVVGLVLVFGHNLLDGINVSGVSIESIIWYLLHQQGFITIGESRAAFLLYPLIPLLGLTVLGYSFGNIYHKDFEPEKRKKLLLQLGSAATLLFFMLRIINIYGDPQPWEAQSTFIYSVLSFFNTTKYPSSLQFLLMTIGPSLLFLYFIEGIKNKLTNLFLVVGRVPLFYYVLHMYLIHLLAFVGVIISGRPLADMILMANDFRTGSLVDYGFGLHVVYAVWIIVVILLFPLCKWFNNYKSNNRDKKWLSYL